ANDRPLLIQYEGAYYFPVFRHYPETVFGGFLPSEADYRDPAVTQMINEKGWIVWPLIPFSYRTITDAPGPYPAAPSRTDGLGTVVRAEFLRARNFDYVRAARALGVSDPVIIFRHVLPNATVATLTFLPFILNGSITTLTSLDFLGFGLPPGSASLGELLAQGKANLQAPWLGITAFAVLAVMLSLLIFIGEAVRDAFDPRKVTP